jgi:glycosyltransferase involved in cell wall biosynthesis
MKILIIQPWIKQGGAELISVYLSYELQRQGHEAPIVCAFINKKGMPNQVNLVEYLLPSPRISSLLARNRLAFFLLGPWVLFWLVWKNSNDVDILNPHNFPSSWIASIVGGIKRIPIVWTCNEPPERIPLRKILQLGFVDYLGWILASSWMDKFLIKKIDAIYVPSEMTSKQVRERYGRDADIIHIGLDAEFFQRSDESRMADHLDLRDKFILLTVGKLHPQKNQKVCIEALRHVVQHIPNAILLIAGNGPMEKRLRDIADAFNVKERIYFLGYLSGVDIRELYRSCDVNLFPAVNQSWGLTPFEALCLGKISIVSNDCGAAELISREDIGIVCEPTMEAIARSVLSLNANQEVYKGKALRGLQFVSKNLSWEIYAQKVLGIMRGIVVTPCGNSIENEVGEEALL